MAATDKTFSPDWLAARLASLVPGYPHVRVCVALSGGLDSTVLLAAAAAIRGDLATLRAIHIDHGLHPNSGAWARHARALARALKVPLKVLRAQVDRSPGVSVEAAAREARYSLLESELVEGEILLTAHHEDDQLETVLLQLFRGAGIAGLAAMPHSAPFARGLLVRPLLTATRADLESWARSRGLTWVEDETNADERFDRNYLRRQVLPLIRNRWPGVGRAVARSAQHSAEAQRLLDLLARSDVERAAYGPALTVKRLRALSAERRRNALRFWIAQAGYPLPDANRLDQIAGPMLEARPDANPHVAWKGALIHRHADLLTLSAPLPPNAESFEPVTWDVTASRRVSLAPGFGALELQPAARGPIDMGALPARLTVRLRQGGERLRPRRGGPSRTLKNLLQQERVALKERSRLPLLFDGDRLVAAGDLWFDAAIQAGPATRDRARLIWHRP
jgi:tRNA(Ile)-lysidine synthase